MGSDFGILFAHIIISEEQTLAKIQYLCTMNQTILQDIDNLLNRGRINEAIDLVANRALGLGLTAEADRIRKIGEDYGLMSKYALDGFADPSREKLLESLTASVRDIAVGVERSSKIAAAPTLYFNTLRFERMQTADSVASLVRSYKTVIDRLNLSALSEDPGKTFNALRRQSEDLERRVFNRVWVSYPLSVDDYSAIGDAFGDASLPDHFKILLIASVFLGQLHYYDKRRLLLLMDFYDYGADDRLQIYALCALMLSLWQCRKRPVSGSLADRFAALEEKPQWISDVRMLLMQFIRTRDTERLNREFNDEVLPRMMKLGPDLKKAMSDLKSLETFSPEENPEWEELFNKSGLADRLKELQEMQEEGADVMMATFGKLKTFPFFNDIANWFMPFHTSHSVVSDAVGESVEGEMLSQAIAASPAFCNSDKFSVILSLAQMPSSQRSMLLSQISGYTAQMAASESNVKTTREALANTFVKDLYRFFKLFRRSNEFVNPFDSPVNLTVHPLLSKYFDDADTLSLVGEFYFKRKYFDDAFDVFSKLSYMVPPSAQLFQKMGYCRQSSGNLAEALDFYEQSELLNGESQWTLRRLAACSRGLGRHSQAAGYYERLSELNPDDATLALNLGHSYLALHRYEEAAAQYYKAEFLGGKSLKTLRPLAWCTLSLGNYDKSRGFYDEILASEPSAMDYSNAGLLELISGNYRKAVDHFASAIAAMDFDVDKFLGNLNADFAGFEKVLPDSTLRAIVTDSAIAAARNLGTSYSSTSL